MRDLKELIDVARGIRPDFEEFGIKPVPGGILASEMLLFLAACKHYGIKNVVESGRRNGYSTMVIGECQNRCWLTGFYSIEIDPDDSVDDLIHEKYTYAKLVKGDGERDMATYYGKFERPTALLLDGPKGPRAAAVADAINPPLFAIHDCHRYHAGHKANPWREQAERRYKNAMFSDDDLWLEEFSDLDREHWSEEYNSREEMTAAGFTLMVVPR